MEVTSAGLLRRKSLLVFHRHQTLELVAVRPEGAISGCKHPYQRDEASSFNGTEQRYQWWTRSSIAGSLDGGRRITSCCPE